MVVVLGVAATAAIIALVVAEDGTPAVTDVDGSFGVNEVLRMEALAALPVLAVDQSFAVNEAARLAGLAPVFVTDVDGSFAANEMRRMHALIVLLAGLDAP